jgi:hypothetical protein
VRSVQHATVFVETSICVMLVFVTKKCRVCVYALELHSVVFSFFLSGMGNSFQRGFSSNLGGGMGFSSQMGGSNYNSF